MPIKAIYLSGIVVLAVAASPFIFAEAEVNADKEFAGIAADILNPDKLFEALKKNITIPTSPALEKTEGDSITLPTPKEALKDASPKLQEVNKDIKDETGIDFAKFIAWFARVLKVFFLTVVDLLETVSGALQKEE
jgi:hypothetical protein